MGLGPQADRSSSSAGRDPSRVSPHDPVPEHCSTLAVLQGESPLTARPRHGVTFTTRAYKSRPQVVKRSPLLAHGPRLWPPRISIWRQHLIYSLGEPNCAWQFWKPSCADFQETSRQRVVWRSGGGSFWFKGADHEAPTPANCSSLG